jgi:hypothetical protein
MKALTELGSLASNIVTLQGADLAANLGEAPDPSS